MPPCALTYENGPRIIADFHGLFRALLEKSAFIRVNQRTFVS